MTGLRYQEIERMRRAVGQSVLLYLTDACPVGCEHCSVDARLDGRRITDMVAFAEIVETVCRRKRIQVVGISGGEPFVERRGLTLATTCARLAGKAVVVYTSGVWAGRTPRVPSWIREVLGATDTVVLSTSQFHFKSLPAGAAAAAALAAIEADCWLVVQTLNDPESLTATREMLEGALGLAWKEHAEVNVTSLLPYGRARAFANQKKASQTAAFGACVLAAAPVVRYDGSVFGCCNEQVLGGGGPEELRREGGTELAAALDAFEKWPALRVIREVGPAALAEHPTMRDIRDDEHESICSLCWRAVARLRSANADAFVESLATLVEKELH